MCFLLVVPELASHISRLITMLPPQSTFITASTGAAACHIGGTTLHVSVCACVCVCGAEGGLGGHNQETNIALAAKY